MVYSGTRSVGFVARSKGMEAIVGSIPHKVAKHAGNLDATLI